MIMMKGITLPRQKGSTPQALVCQLCQISASPAPRLPPQFARAYTTRPFTRKTEVGQLRSRNGLDRPVTFSRSIPRRFASTAPEAPVPQNPEAALAQIEQELDELRNTDAVPSNEKVVTLLHRCQELAEALALPEQDSKSAATRKDDNEISHLLDLEEKNQTRKRTKSSPKDTIPQFSSAVSRVAYELLSDEKVFITPEALASYSKIQTLLKRPEHFPEIFYQYAHKPHPEEGSSPVKYHKASPKDINSAIPVDIANMALGVAIEQRNLPLVLSIIDHTFCAPAFHRAKVFKKAAIPLGGLAAAPAACYAVASWAASMQNTMDPSTATGIAFAAILAYVGGTSSVGLLAITTANDQMERVVWQPGMPLRHRWLREEERAALDKVALAWGFKDEYMRGEEEGEEWESLREFIGMRGMVLDKTELMPGME
ncbi:hypothetical protein BDW42DRAFT_163017 [Aspergillus taichungensis]|uniref:Uncharacterized protein n=1 Tax=Aspergillus taichungensis TaxID=482145 RepID=A0A2J5I3D0_9EURO|nr:hypothetical protein BDW42DRAFT_163017 [Aspergillus taichungensis]